MPRTSKTAKPARKPPPADPHALSTRLREIARNRGLTPYAIAREAGIDPGMLSRFLNGERDIRLATADAIARALGLRLVEIYSARPGLAQIVGGAARR
jgi:transcriptional regulator with XRE-family HTH domain